MSLHFTAKLSILCFILFCDFIISKKISLPDLHRKGSNKINNCQRCKVLTDSFNLWLEKTARGHYDGGDTAWEEAKLKSYARSEIRLVEIQEGLCSELKKHRDHCYSLAEEAEQPLEKWWFHEDPNRVDLYHWLCIDTLQYCCPKNHFGESCQSCPIDTSNKVCGGNGKCDGDGTRKGNGTCLCQSGYSGDLCLDCNENSYRASLGLCKPCHKSCEGCTGEGPTACTMCSSGWQLVSGICVDVNECSNPSACYSNQFCINHEGSYVCEACDESCVTCSGGGPSNCTSCEPNAVLWSSVCIDDALRYEIVTQTLQRLALYFCFLVPILYMFRNSKLLKFFIVFIFVIYVYFTEKTSKINLLNGIINVLNIF